MFDIGAATAREIATAATGVCHLVLLCDYSSPTVAKQARLLEAVAEVIRIDDLTAEQVSAYCHQTHIRGITTFCEGQLTRTNQIAALAGFSCHSDQTLRLCTDKTLQRVQLNKSGASNIRNFEIAHISQLALAIKDIGYPCVLKPVNGVGSRDAYKIRSKDDVSRLHREIRLPESRFVLEELVVGDPKIAGDGWGDYVSVELFTSAERVHRAICVTGKFPLAEPFRETGAVVPSTLETSDQFKCIEVAQTALTALGIGRGVTHVELKLTDVGPQVIEVNARVGGYVPALLRRSANIDLIEIELRSTIESPVQIPPVNFGSVEFQYLLQPPTIATRLNAVSGMADVRALDGILQVQAGLRPGDAIESGVGTSGYIATVHGSATRHQDALVLVRAVHDLIDASYI